MRPPRFVALFLFALPAVAQRSAQPAVDPAFLADPSAWTAREVGDGVVLKQRWFASLFAGPQSVTVLELQSGRDSLRFDVEAEGKLMRTSAMAVKNEALAAINGGFFGADASPRGLLRLDGALVAPANDGQGSIGIDERGGLVLAERPAGDWPQCKEALGAGVVLVRDGKVVDHGKRQRSIRHPRSAIGTTNDGRILLVTIDGRTDKAVGTSYEETAQLLTALGCTFAINLDGGGSSTLWVASIGVCNYPCDNKQFDHQGERAVANALLVHAPAVVVVDDDDAELRGVGFAQRTEGTDIRGADCTVWQGDGDCEAVFAAELPFAGTWRALLWTPRIGLSTNTVRADVAFGHAVPDLSGTPIEGKPGEWIEIERFSLPQKGRVAAHLTNARGASFVADAVKFVQAR